MNTNYEELWKKIQKYDNDGLPESAMKLVDSIFSFAKADKNSVQQIKSLIHRAKYTAELDEEGMVKSVALLEQELKSNDEPIVKSVLHSILAELYSNYFNANLWPIKERTVIQGDTSGTIETWAKENFLSIIRSHYLASVQDPSLKTSKIADFIPILTEGKNSDSLRPTLYDVLSHRAIEYFSNGQSDLDISDHDNVIINDPTLFAHTDQFIQSKDGDSSTYFYLIVRLFKDLEAYHRKDANQDAWIDVVKKRLEYVFNHFQGDEKNKLYESALDQWIKVSGTPKNVGFMLLKAELYARLGREYSMESPDSTYKMYLVKAKAFYQEIISNYKGTPEAIHAENLLNDISHPMINGQAEKVNLINKPFRILIDYQNTSKAFIKVIPVTIALRQQIYAIPGDQVLNKILGEKEIYSAKYDLPSADDMQHHSVEVKIDPLPVGMYAIIFSDDARMRMGEDIVTILYTHISNLAYLHTMNSYTVRTGQSAPNNELVILHRESGSPLSGVKASFYENQYQATSQKYAWILQATAISDINGKVNTNLPKNKTYSIQLEKQTGDPDFLWLDDGFSNSSYYQEKQKDVEDALFFLDRSIYRPGQTIYFKALALLRDADGKVKILKNRKIDIALNDANGQEVIKKSFNSNEFGTINGSFAAPIGGLTGNMSLVSNLNNASTFFTVEEYKRPKFEVLFDTNKVTSKLNEAITITGTAKNLAGNAVDQAKVKYKVSRQRWSRPMPWWYWKSYPIPSHPTIISQGILVTDNAGKFSIPFTATSEAGADMKKDELSYTYLVEVDITDFTGETRSANVSYRIGNQNLILSSTLIQYENRDSLKDFNITGTDLNGQPLQVNGNYSISKLIEPTTMKRSRYWNKPDQYLYDEKTYHGWFPIDIYSNENQVDLWPVGQTLINENFDTKKPIAIKKPLATGIYKLEVSAKNAQGTASKYEQYFWVEDPSIGEFAGIKSLALYQDKSQLEPDVPMHYSIQSKSTPQYILQSSTMNVESQWSNNVNSIKNSITLKEANRGELHQMNWYMVKDNRVYQQSMTFGIPWSNKELTIETVTFRDKLIPGQNEEWKLKISGNGKEKLMSEIVASMYDQSLDALYPHAWNPDLYHMNYLSALTFNSVGFGAIGSNIISFKNYPYTEVDGILYRDLNWFGFEMLRTDYMPRGGKMMKSMHSDAADASMVLNESMPAAAPPQDGSATKSGDSKSKDPNQKTDPPFQPRKNLNETVFFFPEIKSDADGNFILKFKMNEALTRWRLMLFGHTQDLQSGYLEKTIVTQKDLMVFPNAPRFVRQGDVLEMPAKIANLSTGTITGNARLELFDPLSNKDLNETFSVKSGISAFTILAGASGPISWTINVPKDYTGLLGYRIIALSGTQSDGEENVIPVLSNRMLVTESYPFQVRANTQKTFDFADMISKMSSTTLANHQYTLECTSNPTWYAIQSLPYMMEFPYECTEQMVNRYYANALAAKVLESNPKIKTIFEAWKRNGDLKSPLEKNQELKSAVLEETPWVKDALNEAEQQKMIALLFDMNKLSSEKEHIIQVLTERQLSNGGFAWFAGRDDWYITQYVVEALGHLKKLGITDVAFDELLHKAVLYCDNELLRYYNDWKKTSKKDDLFLPDIAMHYLYARSFYPEIEIQDKSAFDYFLPASEKLWLKQNIYAQGMIALALHRWQPNSILPAKTIASLKERAQHSEELGMYWKFDHGYRYFELPIETQSLIIEAFNEIAKDQNAVNEMRLWLLKNKQTNHWPSTKSTASAIYALMLNGDDWTQSSLPAITMGNEKINIPNDQVVPGLGYFKVKKDANQITKDLAHVTIQNPNNHILWGAAYWQYFEDLNAISGTSSKPFTIIKKMYTESTDGNKTTLKPFTSLQVGDKLIVRLEIKVDRPMEYIHLKDLRAAGLEPIDVISQYRYQGGLGYYQSTKDLATHFFFDHISTGTYVLEYPVRVAQRGIFSNGISTMQCMYAPEFSGHTNGEILTIK